MIKKIKKVVKKYETKIKNNKKDSDRKNPVDSDIERSLKSMGYQEIKEIILKGDEINE